VGVPVDEELGPGREFRSAWPGTLHFASEVRAASVRIEALLRALGVEEDAVRRQLVQRVQRRLQMHVDRERSDGAAFAELAVTETFALIDDWVLRAVAARPGEVIDALPLRVALLNGTLEDWPSRLLSLPAREDGVRLLAKMPRPLPPPAPMAMPTAAIRLRQFRPVRGLLHFLSAALRRPGAAAATAATAAASPAEAERPGTTAPVHAPSRARRLAHAGLVTGTVALAVSLLAGAVSAAGVTPLELFLLLLYMLLSGWIALSFWTAVAGFLVLLARHGRRPSGVVPATSTARVALVMPIYNEDPPRILAGIEATWRTLGDTPEAARFDIHILSDTRDPDLWMDEELAWLRVCTRLNAHGRIFYRNRPDNVARKSGNIAEFIQRCGATYPYFVILDADSIMSGETLVELLARMERSPATGLIQVPPVPVNRSSLFARILQFSGALYGRMYCAGLAFWQRGESNFWGHNAIIRTTAFASCSGLPRLPGREPFGGEILSHDFVEAALMARAGWAVELAWDLAGSYEEIPPTLIDYAKRDRRWCQGNLQHARIALAHDLRLSSRVHLGMGVMSYVASPLWLLFLVLTAAEAWVQGRSVPVYFLGETFVPLWPESYSFELTSVMYATLVMLFLPKVLALALLLVDPRTRYGHGGLLGATASVLLEVLFSVLLAPVMMLFQTKFVVATLLRRNVGWPAQQRDDRATRFLEAVAAHAEQTITGLVVGLWAWWLVPGFFWWFTPVLAGLVLAVPFSMLTSRVDLGLMAARAGLFLSPDERSRPRCLQYLDEALAAAPASLGPGFWQTLNDPFRASLRMAIAPAGLQPTRRERHRIEGLLLALEDDGIDALDRADRRYLLSWRQGVAGWLARAPLFASSRRVPEPPQAG
jgi:membrane glycosyltransferase